MATRATLSAFGLVRGITYEILKLGLPNLVIGCIMGWSQIWLYMAWFDLDLQGHLGSKWSKLAKNGLVWTITFEGLKLGSPNLACRCIMGRSWMRLYMSWFDLDLQGHLGSKRSKLAKNGLVRKITLRGLKLGSSNFSIRSIICLDLGWDYIWHELTLTLKVIRGQNGPN